MSFERIEPNTTEWEAYYANHIQRYMFAAQKLEEFGKTRILDAACGVGYGSHYLAEALNATVIGIDRNSEALKIAANNFSHPSVTFCADDCEELSKAKEGAPFDAVVSFETIEHLKQPARFLDRIRDLLAPNGLLLMSSPNSRVSDPNGSGEWEFHEREFTAPEFKGLLAEAGFRNVSLFGQKTTALGRLRSDLRAELNTLRFNPLMRMGKLLQRVLRGRKSNSSSLPETLDDFEIIPLASAEECDALGSDGPFVLVCIASL